MSTSKRHQNAGILLFVTGESAAFSDVIRRWEPLRYHKTFRLVFHEIPITDCFPETQYPVTSSKPAHKRLRHANLHYHLQDFAKWAYIQWVQRSATAINLASLCWLLNVTLQTARDFLSRLGGLIMTDKRNSASAYGRRRHQRRYSHHNRTALGRRLEINDWKTVRIAAACQ